MNKSTRYVVLGMLAGLLILLLAACGGSAAPQATTVLPTATSPPPTPTPVPPEPTATPVPPEPTLTPVPPEPTPTSPPAEAQAEIHGHEMSDVEEGKRLFAEKACAACHGPEAQGTEGGPALPGHTPEQIRRQVREPLGKMPPFTEEQVSEAELEQIIAFITTLAPSGAMHMHEYEMSTPVQAHLRMAVISLESDNADDAKHHVEHAIAVAEGEQAKAVQEVLDGLSGGDVHAVQHELEEILAEAHAVEGKTLGQLHLELALSAVEARDIDDARHRHG